MGKKIRYRQARMRRATGEGAAETTSWIPEQFAVVGGVVDLCDDGEWTRDWEVLSVSSDVLEEAPDWRKAIRGHRKQTGDALPRGRGS